MPKDEDDEDFHVSINGKEIGNPLLKVIAFLLGILLMLTVVFMLGPFLLCIIGIAVFIVVLCVVAALITTALTLGVLAIPHFILRRLGRNGFFVTNYMEDDGDIEANFDIDLTWNAFKKRQPEGGQR